VDVLTFQAFFCDNESITLGLSFIAEREIIQTIRSVYEFQSFGAKMNSSDQSRVERERVRQRRNALGGRRSVAGRRRVQWQQPESGRGNIEEEGG